MFLYLFIATLTLIFLYLKKTFNFWRSKGIPQNDQWNPLGDMWDIGLKMHMLEKLDLMYKKYKGKAPFFGMYMMTSASAVVTDLDLLRSILVKDFNNFMDRGMYHNEEADKLTMNMFGIEGEKWKRIRNSLSPVFTSGKIKGMFHIIEEKGKGLIKYFEERSSNPDGINAKDANSRFTADIISSTAFGLETQALHTESPYILELLQRVFGMKPMDLLKFMFLALFPNFSAWLKLRQFDTEVEGFFEKTVKDAVDHRSKNNIKRSDFLNMLINLMNRGTINDSGDAQLDQKLTFNEILAQAFLFFAAGYETSSVSMNFSMYFLGKHPEIQQRLRDEVREIKEKHGGKIDYDAVMEMTYLNQVFNESLRIFTPIGQLLRKTKQDYKVPNTDFVIPAGTMVQVPVHSIHRDAEYYPNPDQFDPDRFTPEEIAKRHPYAFLPFGEGPRNCLGMRFAQLQVKYALAVVVDTFELSVNPKTKEPLKFDKNRPNPSIEGDIWINFKKLEN